MRVFIVITCIFVVQCSTGCGDSFTAESEPSRPSVPQLPSTHQGGGVPPKQLVVKDLVRGTGGRRELILPPGLAYGEGVTVDYIVHLVSLDGRRGGDG